MRLTPESDWRSKFYSRPRCGAQDADGGITIVFGDEGSDLTADQDWDRRLKELPPNWDRIGHRPAHINAHPPRRLQFPSQK
jgi:hypothetical protein